MGSSLYTGEAARVQRKGNSEGNGASEELPTTSNRDGQPATVLSLNQTAPVEMILARIRAMSRESEKSEEEKNLFCGEGKLGVERLLLASRVWRELGGRDYGA